ncbi:hypothetical protein GCM10027018_17260 [Paenibacillus thermoaerophilus]
MGRAAALAFAGEGAAVALCGRRLGKIEAVRTEIESLGGQAIAVRADVSEADDVARFVRETIARFGRIDVAVNNAAVFEPGLTAELTHEEWQRQIAVNLTGPFLVTREVLPHMRRQRYGRFVNITSGLAGNGAGGYAAYSAAKSGLESLTRTVADEEARYGILANAYNPGTIRSEMHATGRDPQASVPELLRLACLPEDGINGRIVAG